MYYVYVYSDLDGVPFYVGKGTKNRAYAHLKSRANTHLGNKIRKLLSEGKTPLIEIFEAANEEDAFELEVSLISELGRLDLGTGSLVNKTDGGDGIRGMSPEAYVMRGSKLIGRVFSEERKQRISQALTGVKRASLSEEHKAKISAGGLGQKRSEETRAKLSVKAKARDPSAYVRRPVSEETREKIRQSRLGKKHSEEVKANMKKLKPRIKVAA